MVRMVAKAPVRLTTWKQRLQSPQVVCAVTTVLLLVALAVSRSNSPRLRSVGGFRNSATLNVVGPYTGAPDYAAVVVHLPFPVPSSLGHMAEAERPRRFVPCSRDIARIRPPPAIPAFA